MDTKKILIVALLIALGYYAYNQFNKKDVKYMNFLSALKKKKKLPEKTSCEDRIDTIRNNFHDFLLNLYLNKNPKANKEALEIEISEIVVGLTE